MAEHAEVRPGFTLTHTRSTGQSTTECRQGAGVKAAVPPDHPLLVPGSPGTWLLWALLVFVSVRSVRRGRWVRGRRSDYVGSR
jgi:hypothetical protein